MVRTPSRRKAWALTLPTPDNASSGESRVIGALAGALSAALVLDLAVPDELVAVAAAGFFLGVFGAGSVGTTAGGVSIGCPSATYSWRRATMAVPSWLSRWS